ncbi:hypothetical protein [Amnibacterium kyonggiense]
MSEPERRSVRVRRSPKIGTFLLIGAAAGVLATVVAVNLTPSDPTISTPQAIGFLALLFAPLGAGIAGVIALVVDRVSERRARVVEAERTAQEPAVAVAPESGVDPGPVERGRAEDAASESDGSSDREDAERS